MKQELASGQLTESGAADVLESHHECIQPPTCTGDAVPYRPFDSLPLKWDLISEDE